MKYQTLHAHTTTSDGLLTYREVLTTCEKNNIGVVAFTDHDSLPSDKTMNMLRNTKSRTKWIVGIEISSGPPKNSSINFSPHVIGLFVNPFNKDLKDHCYYAQKARDERMRKMVKNLTGLGFDISAADCLKVSGGEAVGRPHIVQALNLKAKNKEVMESLRKKMKADAENDGKVKEQYDLMMEQGESQYPYVLFLSDDSYIKGVYVDYGYRIDLDTCVKIIRNSGGVALFAHWFTEIKKFGAMQMEKLLKENRLDGVETVFGFYDDIRDELIKERKILKSLVRKYNKVEGGGVDAHTKEHFEDFSKDEWYAKITAGLAEKIISKSEVDVTWSSFKNKNAILI